MNHRCTLAAVAAFTISAGCQTNTQKGMIGHFNIGERAQIGSMIYNVFDTQYQVSLGEGAEVRIPKNRFLLVHLSAVNGGGATNIQSIPAVTLVDDAGQSYNELDNGAGVQQWLGFARRVRPAESLSGEIIFDVPPKHYQLRLSDEADEHYALVDLPLSFGDPVAPVEGPRPAAAPASTR